MKRPGFFEGVLVAALLAASAGIAGTVLAPLLGASGTVRLVIPALGLAYVLYLLCRSGERTGRPTALAAWATLAVVSAWFVTPLPFYLAIHAGAVWLLRSLYFHAGVLPALLDLALGAASIVFAAWAATQSGSLAMTTWCFFLVQALFVLIPTDLRSRRQPAGASVGRNESFARAQRQAEAALQQLFTRY